MRANMGTIDRVIRSVLAATVLLLILAGRLNGLSGVLLLLGAIAFLTSALTGYCPSYAPFRINTGRRR